MYNKILQYFNGAVASKDSQEITRAAKWFFLAHQLIYRPPRHSVKRRKRTIVYKARLNSFLRGDFRDLLVDFVADRGLAIVRAEHQGPRDPGDPTEHRATRAAALARHALISRASKALASNGIADMAD